jgi:hypothetical protein
MRCFKIDRDIPAPPSARRVGRPLAWPWDRLEVGDSVLLTSEDVAKTGQIWAERHGRRFIRQKQTDGTGWRLWRQK